MKRFVSTVTIVCFLFVHVSPVPADSFGDAVQAGRSFGSSLGSSVNPKDIDPAQVVPGYDPSQTGSYSQFYTNPAGMSETQLSPLSSEVKEFMRQSNEQRPRYNLEDDPVFGNRCLEWDVQGRCTQWSLSKDILTQTYPDCERVLIPEYEAVTYEKCTGTKGVSQTPECTIRRYVDIQVSEVQGPCSEADIKVLPDQIYAICKDRVEIYRLLMGTLDIFCGHGKYADDVLCADGRCSLCYNTLCPTGYVVTDESELPEGAVYIGDGVASVWLSGSSGHRVAHGTWYKFYKVTHPSVVERVFVRRDTTCSREDLSRWMESCSIFSYVSCDSEGQNCVNVFQNGEETGELPPERCSTYSATVTGFTTEGCGTVCESDGYQTCIEDCKVFTSCSGCSSCTSCSNGCAVCSRCESCADPEGGLNCTGCTNCADCMQGQLRCTETVGCGSCSFCNTDYDFTCLEGCEESWCQESCGLVAVNEYTVCTLSDTSEGIRLNGRILSSTPEITVQTVREKNKDITLKIVAGGPGVMSALNDWYAKVSFACYGESDACQELIDRGCTLYSSTCVDESCSEYEYTYKCGTGKLKRYIVGYNCSGQIRCIGTDCADSSYDASGDFGYAVAFGEILNMVRTDTLNNEIFPGKVMRCQSAPKNCCKPTTGGVSLADYVRLGTSMYRLYRVASQGFTAVAGEYASNMTTLVNTMAAKLGFAETTVSSVSSYSAAYTASTIQSSAGITTISTVYEVPIGTTQVVASTPFATVSTIGTVMAAVQVVMIAYAIASFLYNYLFACTNEDYQTSVMLGFNVCHYIGTKSEKKLGLIKQSWRYYCCFNSILARIIHEQGRPQIGKQWGNYRTPHCEGFTPEELASIDFSNIDLSEYTQYLTIKKELSQEEVDNISRRIQERFP